MSRPSTRRFTRHDYYRMLEAEILTEDDRVELVDGAIVEMTPSSARHAAAVRRIGQILRGLGDRVLVSEQNPIALDRHNEPEPDVAVVKARTDGYAHEHPMPADVLLLVEVAVTSARRDRRFKLKFYANAGIPIVWLVDLSADRLEAHSDPSTGRYRTTTILGRNDRVVFDGTAFDVGEILGPR